MEILGISVYATFKGQRISDYPWHLSLEILGITSFTNLLRKLNVSHMNKDKHSSEEKSNNEKLWQRFFG